jgi:hypothetical protein
MFLQSSPVAKQYFPSNLVLIIRSLTWISILLIILACASCNKKPSTLGDEPTEPVVKKPFFLDEETFGMGIKLGSDINAPLHSPYSCKRSGKVEITLAGKGSPVFSFLIGDSLAATYVYREDLWVIQAVMLTPWMPDFAPPDQRKDPKAYFAKLLAAAQKAREKYPKVQTARGIGIYSTKDEVIAAYGTPDKLDKRGWPYYKDGNFALLFGLAEDRVVMIVEMSTMSVGAVASTVGRIGGG